MDWSQSQTKLFRILLRFYPAEFRNEYGAEMEHLFADRLHTESPWRLWLDTAADLVLSAFKEHWHILLSDLRYGIRVLAAAPAFTAIALSVIALGIGATVSIFSLVNAVLLRSLPFGHPEKLVYLWSPNSNFKGVPEELGPNVPDFYEWQRHTRCFSALALFRPAAVNIVQNRSVDRIGAAFVSGTFFPTLGTWPELGRALDKNDDRPGQERVAVISNSFWRSRFGASPDAIGKQIQVNRHNYTVVGVMPKDFGYPVDGDVPYERSGFKQTDLWLPAAYTDNQKSNRADFQSADAIGRLAPGVSAATAQAELSAIELRLQPLYSQPWKGWTVLVRPLVETIIGPVQTMLWLLLGAVSVVLLIAISNVTNLLLVRATARSHELGIRTALGAERGRIVRQLLTESLLLSLAGGALGVALAFAAVQVLRKLNPGGIPRFDAAVDGRALLVAVTLSILAGVVSGLIPAISASRSEINTLLRSGGAQLGGNANRGQFSLIVLEVALSVLLLVGSGLLIRSYLQLAAVHPGFSPATLTFKLSLDDRYNKPEQRNALYKNFLARLQTIHGIEYVGASNSNPLTNQESASYAETQGFGRTPEMVETRSVTPGYRKALGTPLLRGRDFDPRDVASKAPLVMVDETFAKKYFPARDPLGKQIRIGIGDLSKEPWLTVSGIVANIRHNNLEEASRPSLFRPADSGNNFAIRCRIPVRQVLAQARAALRSLDPALALEGVHTMRERMNESNARRTFQTALLTGFAAIAVALALIGLYGLTSYTVKQRTREIAIRLAVGATRARILQMVLSQALKPTALGLLIGLASAFALTRLLTSWLFDVKATDPLTFIAVPAFVLVVAALACLVPAWTATRIDPIQPLRNE